MELPQDATQRRIEGRNKPHNFTGSKPDDGHPVKHALCSGNA
jgi:hypothetical protein